MKFQDIELMFNRSFAFAFSKKKFLLLFPALATCGLVTIFCKALSLDASKWVQLSLSFLPIFICFGILLGTGILLNRIYYREIKGMDLTYKNIIKDSLALLINSTYLSLPFILLYFILWMTMGVFYLLKEIPAIGEFIGVILSFAPFVIVLMTLLLCIISIVLLFFATPHISLKKQLHLSLFEDVLNRLSTDIFANIILFIIGLTPLALAIITLGFSATVTGLHFSIQSSSIAITMQWFFIMLPFCALIAPAMTFFFNFSMEAFGYQQKRIKNQS